MLTGYSYCFLYKSTCFGDQRPFCCFFLLFSPFSADNKGDRTESEGKRDFEESNELNRILYYVKVISLHERYCNGSQKHSRPG